MAAAREGASALVPLDVEDAPVQRANGFSRVLGLVGVACALVGLVAWGGYATPAPTRMPMILFVPQVPVPGGPPGLRPSTPPGAALPALEPQAMPSMARPAEGFLNPGANDGAIGPATSPSAVLLPFAPQEMPSIINNPDAILGQTVRSEPMSPLTLLAAIAGSLGVAAAAVFTFVKAKSAKQLAEASARAEQMKVPAMSAVAALALTMPATAQDVVTMSPHSALDDSTMLVAGRSGGGRTGGRVGGRAPTVSRAPSRAPTSAYRPNTTTYRTSNTTILVPGGYGGYGYGGGFGYSPFGGGFGGPGLGTYLGLSLAETFIREQQRQSFLQQQLETQRQLGQDQAAIQQLQRELSAQNAKVETLKSQQQNGDPNAKVTKDQLIAADQAAIQQLQNEVNSLKANQKPAAVASP